MKRQQEENRRREEEERRERVRKSSALLQDMKKTSEKKEREYRGIVTNRPNYLSGELQPHFHLPIRIINFLTILQQSYIYTYTIIMHIE